jgi:2-oxoglutarate dehydrogenase E2 component (dihydrolipoamide succinyltransferase)
MSTFEIKMPKLGESITEGTIMTWSVKVGDNIKEDDILFEVSTAKVNAEVPSPVDGVILEILFKEGDTVPVGEIVALVQLESGEESVVTDKKVSEKSEPSLEKSVSAEPSDASKPSEQIKTKSAVSITKEETRWYSPVVLQIASESKISADEIDKIPGTGYLGRLSKKDVSNYIEQKKKGVPSPVKTSVEAPRPIPTPSVSNTFFSNGNNEIKEMDQVQRIIADRMVQSKHTSPHVTTVVEADVTKLVNWRKRQKDAFQKREGISLTYLPSIVEATAKALIDFPQINASVDGYRVILKKHINIGIAVSLSDGNLIVPVIRDADKMSISGLALAIDSLANRARSNELKINDIQGGTFTITNFGTFRNIIGTPIINQPEVAILGIGYIEKKPAVIETPEGDMIAIRHKMYLSLSYDHRIINGSLGGAFLKRIADYLENWDI